MASISDVAKLAGVAISTVSLVQNNKGYVSDKTREKVLAAIEELNYVPSTIARNLALNRTNIIGVIVPNLAHPFFAETVAAIEKHLSVRGYSTMVCSTELKQNAESMVVDMLRCQTMDGIIMGAHSLDLSIYNDLKRPIVAFDRFINSGIPVVHADHEQGGRMVAEAVIRKKCRYAVIIHGASIVNSPANEWHEIFKAMLHEAGIRLDVCEMPWNAFTDEDFLDTARKLFVHYPEVDAIIGNDLAICAVAKMAHILGKRIPDDLKLIAYDGTSITRLLPQELTSVVQPIDALAELAVEQILAEVNNEHKVFPTVLPMMWQEGETC